MLICCVNGSLLRKRLKPSSWPDCGAGRTPGSLTPSPVLADAEVEPTAVAASAPVAPVAPVAVAAVVVAAGEALALDWWSIFSVRGPWKARTPTRRAPRTPAMIFCFLAFAFGSIFLATA